MPIAPEAAKIAGMPLSPTLSPCCRSLRNKPQMLTNASSVLAMSTSNQLDEAMMAVLASSRNNLNRFPT